MKKAIACIVFLIPLGLFSGCSGDEPEPQGPGTESNKLTVASSTTKMPSAGVLESEYADSPLGFGLSKLIDGNNTTKFVTPHSSFYLLWSGREIVPVNYYSLTSADDAPENDPKSWSIYGSNDNSSWTLLDKQSGQKFDKRKEKKEFELSNTMAFKYVKLEMEANNGGDATQIAGFSLLYIRMNIDDLMGQATGFTEVPSTPMGSRFAGKHVTTEEDRIWLATASNEPSVSQASDNSSWSLKEFSVRLYPTAGNPSPADANQHGIGNCSAIAVFGSFAYIYPDFVKSIITDHGDGTFTIAMFDPQGLPVDVRITSKFAADGNGTIQAVSGKNNVACWSTVLEKAIMKWNAVYKVNYTIGGIGTEHVSPLFTGNGSSFAFGRGVLTNEQLARAVEISLKQGKIVVGGFSPGGVPVGNTQTVTAHAYTLMHSTDRSALFSMRNPWGGNPNDSASADGVVDIPDNNTIPPIIDLRIVDPGKAAQFGSGVTDPYTPPVFAPGTAGMRVSPELMISGM